MTLMAEAADVTVRNIGPRPTAVVKATTTWRDFPTQWRPMLHEVYAWLRRRSSAKQGCNVMLYLDDVAHVEVGVELIAPCVLDDPVVRSALPAGSAASTGGSTEARALARSSGDAVLRPS